MPSPSPHDSEMSSGTNVRSRLLEAAERLFYQNGYHRTGINRIIDEAGVAKASFYNHFSSKEDLGVAFARRHHRAWMKELKECVQSEDDPERKLEVVFAELEALTEQDDFRGCALLNLASEFPSEEHPVRVQVRRQKQEVRDYLRKLVEGGAAKGASNEEESSEIDSSSQGFQAHADAIYLLYEAAMVESQNFGESWPAGVARKTARHLLKSTTNGDE